MNRPVIMTYLLLYVLVTVGTPVFRSFHSYPGVPKFLMSGCNCGCGGDLTKCCCGNHSKIVGFTVCSTEKNNQTPAVLLFFPAQLGMTLIVPGDALRSTVVSQRYSDHVLPGFARLVFHPPIS